MQDLLLKPARIVTSKPAQRTYLNTFLLAVTSSILLGAAVFAYAAFYWNYIPQIGIERIVHLQYGDGPHPYGIVKLDASLVSQQQYDVSLNLHVPRSPRNIEVGNFMVSVSLLRNTYTPPLPTPQRLQPLISKASILHKAGGPIAELKKEDVLLIMRRPAILTYTSRLVSLGDRLLSLPLYLLGLRKESELLRIPLAELVSFPRGNKGGNVPEYALLEIEAGQDVQVYDVKVAFKARFAGLRWWMYNHRFISAAVGVGAFWGAEVLFTLLAWVALRSYFGGTSEDEAEQARLKSRNGGDESEASTVIKPERFDQGEYELSDTERTFPTYGKQKPLKYERKVKVEEGLEDELVLEDAHIQPLEADDEDEDGEGVFRDSGVGTSYSEAGGRDPKGLGRRRKSGRGAAGGADD